LPPFLVDFCARSFRTNAGYTLDAAHPPTRATLPNRPLAFLFLTRLAGQHQYVPPLSAPWRTLTPRSALPRTTTTRSLSATFSDLLPTHAITSRYGSISHAHCTTLPQAFRLQQRLVTGGTQHAARWATLDGFALPAVHRHLPACHHAKPPINLPIAAAHLSRYPNARFKARLAGRASIYDRAIAPTAQARRGGEALKLVCSGVGEGRRYLQLFAITWPFVTRASADFSTLGRRRRGWFSTLRGVGLLRTAPPAADTIPLADLLPHHLIGVLVAPTTWLPLS